MSLGIDSEPKLLWPLTENKADLVRTLKQYGQINSYELLMWKEKSGGDAIAALMMMVVRKQMNKLLNG